MIDGFGANVWRAVVEIVKQSGFICQAFELCMKNVGSAEAARAHNRGPKTACALLERYRPIEIGPHSLDCLCEKIDGKMLHAA
jgi:hypothetical protein